MDALKKPAKTREELKAVIICEWPTGLAISAVSHEDSWKVEIMTDGPLDVTASPVRPAHKSQRQRLDRLGFLRFTLLIVFLYGTLHRQPAGRYHATANPANNRAGLAAVWVASVLKSPQAWTGGL